MRRAVAVAVLTLALVPGMADAGPAAQVVDPADDANAGAYWAENPDTVTPAGSQRYADVTAVRFATTKRATRVGRRVVTTVTGFTVSMTLVAEPSPPAGTGIYRVVALSPRCIVGIDHYTRALPDPAQPRTAFVSVCGNVLRRTRLDAPVVKGGTLTWTVPLRAIPADAGVRAGATLNDLHFETYLAHETSCAQSQPGAEQPPCAVLLDTTFRRDASFVLR